MIATGEKISALSHWVYDTLVGGVAGTSSPFRYAPDILKYGFTRCDQSSRVLMWLATELFGLDCRLAYLRHTDGLSGHVVAEVRYDEEWWAFDPFYGVVLGTSCNQFSGTADETFPTWTGKDGAGYANFYVQAPVYEYYGDNSKKEWGDTPDRNGYRPVTDTLFLTTFLADRWGGCSLKEGTRRLREIIRLYPEGAKNFREAFRYIATDLPGLLSSQGYGGTSVLSEGADPYFMVVARELGNTVVGVREKKTPFDRLWWLRINHNAREEHFGKIVTQKSFS